MKKKIAILMLITAILATGCSIKPADSGKTKNPSSQVEMGTIVPSANEGENKPQSRPLEVRAAGRSRYGEILVVAQGPESQIASSSLKPEYGHYVGYRGNYDVIFNDIAGKTRKIFELKDTAICYEYPGPLTMEKLVLGDAEFYCLLTDIASPDSTELYVFAIDSTGSAFAVDFLNIQNQRCPGYGNSILKEHRPEIRNDKFIIPVSKHLEPEGQELFLQEIYHYDKETRTMIFDEFVPILETRELADEAVETLVNAINNRDAASLSEKALEYYNVYFKGNSVTDFEYVSFDFNNDMAMYRMYDEDGTGLDVDVVMKDPGFYACDIIKLNAGHVDRYLEMYTSYIAKKDVEELASLIYANEIGEPYPEEEMKKLMDQCRNAAQKTIEKYEQSIDLGTLKGRFAGSIEGFYFLCELYGTKEGVPAKHTIQIYCDASGFDIRDEWCPKVRDLRD